MASGAAEPLNILLLSRYTRLGASSRLRTLQYIPALQLEGLSVQVAPFFDDIYLQKLYYGQKWNRSILKYTQQRIETLRAHKKPDMVWLEYEALPWIPWLIERRLLPRTTAIVSDYDDAIFHRYDTHSSATVRALLRKKIGSVMAASDLTIVGNSYLGDYALRFGAQCLEVVPTVVDLANYGVRPHTAEKRVLRIGWIGTPQTWKELASPIHRVLDQLLAERGAMFRAVGAGMQDESNGTLEILPWTEASEVKLIQSMDIGVMPLPDTPWSRGKCGYKLIQYMACGLPVVASPVGVNRDIVEHGVNGFLAEGDDEWRTAVTTLLNDTDLRHRMGVAGRRKVEEQYSLQVWGPRVAHMLRSVAEGRFGR